jgi:hypothetical protein
VREHGLTLYKLLGSSQKTLRANPGRHSKPQRATAANITRFPKHDLNPAQITHSSLLKQAVIDRLPSLGGAHLSR